MIDWKAIDRVIMDADRILLTTHENPDGDGLGCAAAMYHHLKEQDKDCRAINHSRLPFEYRFLNPGNFFETYNRKLHGEWMSQVDLVIIFDVGDFKRLRSIKDDIQRYNLPTMNIDHHPLVDNYSYTYNLVDEETAASGELLYDYLKTVRGDLLPKNMYEGIYTAILTDTGSFRYNNTNTKCHEIAIECIRAGINPTKIYQQVYESNSPSRIKLFGKILATLQYEHNGELAWFEIDKTMLDEAGAIAEDVGGFTDFVRTIRSVEVALMILENDQNSCRVNFRSKGKYKVNRIARALGGGGHQFAAGAVVEGVLKTVRPKVLEETKRSMSQQKN